MIEMNVFRCGVKNVRTILLFDGLFQKNEQIFSPKKTDLHSFVFSAYLYIYILIIISYLWDSFLQK